jgi:L-alanine-DL-glutamate epimerase-like enolase superfamily enzyme
MRDRSAVAIRAIDVDGVVGWGETWCNFPTVGAEHRARLINETCAPIVTGEKWNAPRDAYRTLTDRLHVLAIQAAEPGPIAQAIAGIDIALWDIAAQRAGLPLWKHLREVFGNTKEEPVDSVPCYASGINPDAPEATALRAQENGHTAFKLKVGFADELDIRNLSVMRETLGESVSIMIDANQSWNLEQARSMAKKLAPYSPYWLEEPIPADRPPAEWKALADVSPIPLAGGENVRGKSGFSAIIDNGAMAFIQPDIAKWGGFSGCYPVACAVLAANLNYFPHYLGGGIGLVASAHLLAAVGGAGMLEVDINPNSLREMLASPFPQIQNGRFSMPQANGLGISPDQNSVAPFIQNLNP